MKSVTKNFICWFSSVFLILLTWLNASGIENNKSMPLDTTGQLIIHVQDAAGKYLYSNIKIYKTGTNAVVKVVNTSQTYLKLYPGKYDIKIYYMELKKSIWLRNVIINTGQDFEKSVRFQFGHVNINVLGPDGKNLYSAVKAYKAGTKELIIGHSSSQLSLKLPLGTYDIQIYSMFLKQDKWMRDIMVTDGIKMEKTIQFTGQKDVKSRKTKKKNIHTKTLQMTGLNSHERNIHTDTLQMTGLSAQERNIHTETLQMTGLNAQERTINTVILQMTGLSAKERIINTDTLQMTGLNTYERAIQTETLQMTGMNE